MEQSASFNAKISLTPSPVMATVLPKSFNVLMINFFCSGDTLPNTVVPFLTSLMTSDSLFPSRETNLSAPSTPALAAILDTVIGLSPEITLTSTPDSLKYLIVLIASGRMLSSIKIIDRISIGPSGISVPVIVPSLCAKHNTRYPKAAYLLTSFSTLL